MLKMSSFILALGISFATAGTATAQFNMIDETEAFSAIESASTAASRIRTITHVPAVGVIWLNVQSLPLWDSREADESDYRIAASRHPAAINRLRAALRANPATRKALAAHGISIDRVVGVRVGSHGALRIFLI
jgi:hypothetical protein